MSGERTKIYTKLCLTLCVAIVCVLAALRYVEADEGESALDEACGGVIEKEQVLRLFGVEEVQELEDGKGSDSSSAATFAECIIEVPNKYYHRIEFDIGTGEDAFSLLRNMWHADISTSGTTSSPIGSGWPGVVTIYDENSANATIVLPCKKGEDGSLVVSATARAFDSDLFLDPSELPGLARVAAGVARNTAKKRACGAEMGAGIKDIPLTPSWTEEEIPIHKSDGSCRGIRTLAKDAAQWKLDVKEVAADETSPVEECFLVKKSRGSVYRLTAFHGILAEAYRSAAKLRTIHGDSGQDTGGGWAWASASCGAGSLDSLFIMSNLTQTTEGLEGFDSSLEFERKVLAAFSEESASRRGCHDVKLPEQR